MRHNLAVRSYWMPVSTAEGEFIARYSEHGLCGLTFPSGAKRRASKTSVERMPARVRRWHAAVGKALRLFLAGRPPGRLPPLDLSDGTDFQKRVWRALREIGWGQTRSYGQMAEAIGKPKAVRAVGGACGANPIPVFVPCHRVLAADNSLGGFSGGLSWKRALLRREGIKGSVRERSPDGRHP
jgi:O-6-methylguanine DNA methyltransferase